MAAGNLSSSCSCMRQLPNLNVSLNSLFRHLADSLLRPETRDIYFLGVNILLRVPVALDSFKMVSNTYWKINRVKYTSWRSCVSSSINPSWEIGNFTLRTCIKRWTDFGTCVEGYISSPINLPYCDNLVTFHSITLLKGLRLRLIGFIFSSFR